MSVMHRALVAAAVPESSVVPEGMLVIFMHPVFLLFMPSLQREEEKKARETTSKSVLDGVTKSLTNLQTSVKNAVDEAVSWLKGKIGSVSGQDAREL